MPNIAKIVGGVFLIVVGATIIHFSNLYHLIDLFTIIAIIIIVFGLYLLLVSFFERRISSTKLNKFVNGNNRKNSNFNNLESKKPAKVFSSPRNEKPNLGNNFGQPRNNRFGGTKVPIDPKRISNKVKDMSRPKNPNEVLKVRDSKSNFTSKNLKFTPNYERPMRVTRKPQRRNNGFINVADKSPDKISKFPTIDRSEEIARALAEDDFIRPIHTEENIGNYNSGYDEGIIENVGVNTQIPNQNIVVTNQAPNQVSTPNNNQYNRPTIRSPNQINQNNVLDNNRNTLDRNQQNNQVPRQTNQTNHNQVNPNRINPNQSNPNQINQYNDLNQPNNNLNQQNNDYSNLNSLNNPNNQQSGQNFANDESKDIYERITEYSTDSKMDDSNQNQFGTPEETSGNDPLKFSDSYIISSSGAMTSQEAFVNIANKAKKEILVEIASIKDMTDEFLSKLSDLKVKMIIEDFDFKDISYVLLISSLLEQGIKIKTMESINNINLIADDSDALIMTEKYFNEDYDFGAVYSDSRSISNIKVIFESAWEIANYIQIPKNN